MKKYNKAFKFRILPTKAQEILIHKTFGSTRLIYNMFLDKRIKLYESEKKSTAYNAQAKELTSLKKELEFLKEVDSMSLQITLKNLDKAFQGFFKKITKYPKFKSKRNTKKSYSTNNVNNVIRIENGRLKFPKLKCLKIKLHRLVPNTHKIKLATISCEPNGAYYVSLLTEFQLDIKPVPNDNNIIGLDYFSKELFVSSENQRGHAPKFYNKYHDKLAKEQRILARRTKGSNNWYKQKLKVGILHSKIKNSRADYLHKLSKKLIDKYNAICIEDLDLKSIKIKNLAKHTFDNAWGMFVLMLEYKSIFSGKQVIKIDRYYPSSKTCSSCSSVKSTLKLDEKIYSCNCGLSIDRDLNASYNILS
ncbi:transposase [Psychrilyobacter sp.]|uniref:RNA-guided endonuclease InsQ/TnpB family protein n=1 Tax=Psychrilyobacter sp. TaxID=2586924 RepID=UPI0030168FFE